MKRNFYSITFQRNLSQFRKLYCRLEKKIRNGSFEKLNARKRLFLLNRVEELIKKLDVVKPGFAAMVAGTSLAFTLAANTTNAQTFVRDTTDDVLKNAVYPYNTPTIGMAYAKPVFVDLDGDGDQDCVIGNISPAGPGGYGIGDGNAFIYYKNTGTATAPVFTVQLYSNDPFNAIVDPTTSPAATFADLDNDGDFDMITGGPYYGLSSYSEIFF